MKIASPSHESSSESSEFRAFDRDLRELYTDLPIWGPHGDPMGTPRGPQGDPMGTPWGHPRGLLEDLKGGLRRLLRVLPGIIGGLDVT